MAPFSGCLKDTGFWDQQKGETCGGIGLWMLCWSFWGIQDGESMPERIHRSRKGYRGNEYTGVGRDTEGMNTTKTTPVLSNKLFLYLTEFFAGMSVMAVERGARV